MRKMSVILKRQRQSILPSKARAAAVAQAEADTSIPSENFATANFYLNIGTATGTPDSFTLDVKIQGSFDNSTWVDLGAAFPQQSTISSMVQLRNVDIFGFPFIRVAYTLAFVNGTTPKLTFDVVAVMSQASNRVAISPCQMTVVDLSVDAGVTIPGPVVLLGVYHNVVMSAHTVTIGDDSAAKITLPASTAAGTKMDCYSALFNTSIKVTPNASSTGIITLFWKQV